jgi:hypothetical protein
MTPLVLNRPPNIAPVAPAGAPFELSVRPDEIGVVKHWRDEEKALGAETFRARVLNPSLTVMIALRVDEDIADVLFARVAGFYEQLPAFMRATVNEVVISNWSFPGDPDVLAVAQWAAGHGRIVFWTSGNPELHVSHTVFDHEAAHLACRGEDLPAGWAGRWAQAQADDDAAFGRWRNLLLRRHCAEERYCVFDGCVSRQFMPASRWLTSYAARTEKLSEDFAEAVSFYLYAERHGGLYRHGKVSYQVRFTRLAPNRRRVLKRWLADGAR